MESQAVLGNRAIVIGASMAGLLAARVLSERFSQVTVLERDELPDGPAARKGTPQVNHAHGLLARGRDVLEELFPGYTEALLARGAKSGDTSRVQNLVGGRLLAATKGGPVGVGCSRLLIEDELRKRVKLIANVQLMSRVDVIEPIHDASRGQVTGVRIRALGDATSRAVEGTLAADLVVDCSGRGSRTPQWLRSWGYDHVEEERVTVGLGYATAYFETEGTPESAPMVVISTASPEMLYPAVLIAQESEHSGRDRWVITVAGFGGDHPDPTIEGIRRRAVLCGSEDLARIAWEAKAVGPALRYGFPHSQRRRFERLRRFPGRFLVMGDGIASFNPTYGQGMTVAACEALALRAALSRGIDGVCRPYFRAAAKIIDNPWRIAVGADLAIPTVQGVRTRAVRFTNFYMSALFRAAERDATVALAFKNVTHLLAAPESLFAPATVVRVLWQALLNGINSMLQRKQSAALHVPRQRMAG